jgi:hypothetical protein
VIDAVQVLRQAETLRGFLVSEHLHEGCDTRSGVYFLFLGLLFVLDYQIVIGRFFFRRLAPHCLGLKEIAAKLR